MPEATIHGSCLCEGVKFSVEHDPEAIFTCYCKHCSKNAGGPSQTSAKYRKEQVKILLGQDLMKTYVLNDNMSGCPKHKVFCGRCGCTLWTIPMKHAGTHWIVRTALIDDGLRLFQPKAEFFASRQVDWNGQVKKFDTMPGVEKPQRVHNVENGE